MKHIYMSIVITRYSYKGLAPDCTLFQKVDDEEMTYTKLDYDTARRMMWELVLAGGDREVSVNPYKSCISTTQVTFWTRH